MIYDTEVLTPFTTIAIESVVESIQSRLPYQAPHINVFSSKVINGQGGSLFEDQSGAAHS